MKEIPIYRSVGGNKRLPWTMRYIVVAYAKVDDGWYDRLVSMGMWLLRGNDGCRYAILQGSGPYYITMHQVVCGHKGWDHKNGDGLDNQEANLRAATHSQQMANRRLRVDSASGEPGVFWESRRNCWRVKVCKDRKVVFNKGFKDKEEAIRVVREQRKKFHGAFVREC